MDNKIVKSKHSGIVTIFKSDFSYQDWKEICEQFGLCFYDTNVIEIHARYSIASGENFAHEIYKYSDEVQKGFLQYHLDKN